MRRAAVAAGLAILSLLTVASPAAAQRVASVPEVSTCDARPELGPGSSGDDVRCLQYLLILLGLPVAFTGEYDQRTADAVRWYQATHPPLTANGTAGEQTLISLGIRRVPTGNPAVDATRPAPTQMCLADAEQKVGSAGLSVVCIQRRLGELGLWSGMPNGMYDATLEKAMKAFQQAHPPLQVDGRAGPRTLAALGIWSGVSPADGVGAGSLPDVAATGPLSAEPEFHLGADGIPSFGNRTPCSRQDAITIATEFARDGADIATQYWAVYIASREGGCRFDAVNINPATRDDSHCTFQINKLSGTFEPRGELGRRGWTPELVKTSMQNCADAASDLWVFCGRGPWTPPYACAPPWAGSRSTPMAPVTTLPPVEPPAVEPPPAEPLAAAPEVPTTAGVPTPPVTETLPGEATTTTTTTTTTTITTTTTTTTTTTITAPSAPEQVAFVTALAPTGSGRSR